MQRPFHQMARRAMWGAFLGLFLVLSACESAENIEEGERIYARGCYSCHGAVGLGDGPTARLMGIKPANLQMAVWGFLGLAISPKLIPASLIPHVLFAVVLWGLCSWGFKKTFPEQGSVR